MKVEFYKHNLTNRDMSNCRRVLNSLFLTTGRINDTVEAKLSNYFKVKNAVCVSSWTSGGHITIKSLGIGNKDEVITTPLSFVSTSNIIEYSNGTTIFVDVDKNTGNINLSQVKEKLNKKTKAILPVHLYGQMVDIKKLKKIISGKNIFIIEDAAHALDAEIDNIKPGQVSDVAIFSFYATKVITSGEGGAIITNNNELASKLKKYRNHGITKSAFQRHVLKYEHYDMEFLGYKYNLTDIQASLLVNQLDLVEQRWKLRKQLWEYYDIKFSSVKNVERPKIVSKSKHSYYLYTIWVPQEKRDYLLNELQNSNIGVAVNFTPIHLMSYYRKKYGYKKGDYPNAELIGSRTITLPFYLKLSKEKINYVVNKVNKLLNG